MTQKKEGFLSYFFRARKDTVLGALVLALVIFGVHKCSGVERDTYKARQMVYEQFEISHSVVANNINVCLQKRKISEKKLAQRIAARTDLVKVVGLNINSIPANAFFTLTQYTRFDNSEATQDLCKFNKKQLKQIINKLDDLDIKIRKELGI